MPTFKIALGFILALSLLVYIIGTVEARTGYEPPTTQCFDPRPTRNKKPHRK